jgi:hypothetical protein
MVKLCLLGKIRSKSTGKHKNISFFDAFSRNKYFPPCNMNPFTGVVIKITIIYFLEAEQSEQQQQQQ